MSAKTSPLKSDLAPWVPSWPTGSPMCSPPTLPGPRPVLAHHLPSTLPADRTDRRRTLSCSVARSGWCRSGGGGRGWDSASSANPVARPLTSRVSTAVRAPGACPAPAAQHRLGWRLTVGLSLAPCAPSLEPNTEAQDVGLADFCHPVDIRMRGTSLRVVFI